MIRIVKVYKRYWWPHIYARERKLLWVKVVDGYRYFVDGVETDLYGDPVERSIDKILGEVSERRLADGSEPVTVKFAEEADVAATADRMIAKYAKTLGNLGNR